MRQLLVALILILPVCSSARGQSAGNAGAALFNQMAGAKCTKPDSALIKPGTSDQYNVQAKGFNDCLRIYVENENNKIARIRAEASGTFDRIMEGSTSQIHDIEGAVNAALIEVRIVNSEAPASDMPPPAATLASFPAAECKKPDEALLRPARGKRAASLQATDKYEQQRLGYESCMRLYVAQAKNEIKQIKANAEIAFKRVADEANPRITQINDDVTQALNDARAASGERDAKMTAIHSPLRAEGLSPAVSQPGGVLSPAAFQPSQNQPGKPGTESVTVTGERLPRSADMPTGAGDPDAISCRAPQQLTDSRLMGPEICKRNRDWAKIFKDGMNISPDGAQLVRGEKERTYNPTTCISRTEYTARGPEVESYCGTPGGQ
jgi:hypothetical protein